MAEMKDLTKEQLLELHELAEKIYYTQRKVIMDIKVQVTVQPSEPRCTINFPIKNYMTGEADARKSTWESLENLAQKSADTKHLYDFIKFKYSTDIFTI